MERTYEILKTTDSLSRAVENQSLGDVQEVMIELRDDMREFEIEDESYSEILEELSELLDILEVVNESSLEGLPEELNTQIPLLINRVDSLYLRNIKNKRSKELSDESVEGIRLERDLYQTKSIQLARVVERYRSALSKQLENQQEIYDTVGEAAQNLMNGVDSSEVLENIDMDRRLEELEQVDDELEKMRSNREEFREKHDLDG
jgi:regulator of sigma D